MELARLILGATQSPCNFVLKTLLRGLFLRILKDGAGLQANSYKRRRHTENGGEAWVFGVDVTRGINERFTFTIDFSFKQN